MAANEFDFEPAGELKLGQVGIANLRVLRLDNQRLIEEMRDRVRRAPGLFEHSAVVIDFGALSRCPDADQARSLIDGLRQAGVLPVALAYGTSQIEALARSIGLPQLSKFRAQYESPADPGATGATRPSPTEPAPESRAQAPAPIADSGNHAGQIHNQPVRSGQQVYAQGRDLVLTAPVGAGAEVLADGSIHVYAPLRGRALAGARGDVNARIFCREFAAELVAVAGHYKLLEEIPANLRGKAVQVWLENQTIRIEELA